MKKQLILCALFSFLLIGCQNNNQKSQTSVEQVINLDVASISIHEEETYQLNVEIIKKGTIIFYSSADENVATVDDDGLVTGIAKGETTVTVRGGNNTFYISVEVLPYEAAAALEINMEKDTYTLAKDDEYVLPITVSYGNQDVTSEVTFSYEIENTNVVSFNGLVATALNAGTSKCVVTATYLQQQASKGIEITVY